MKHRPSVPAASPQISVSQNGLQTNPCAEDSARFRTVDRVRGCASSFGNGEHRRALEFASAESIKRGVRFFQGERFCLRLHWNTWREVEEFFAIASGQIRHRGDHAFFPKVSVRK